MGITSLDMISVDDVGDIVRVIFNNRTGHLHKTHSVCGDKQTIKEMAQILSRHLSPLYFQDKQVLVCYGIWQKLGIVANWLRSINRLHQTRGCSIYVCFEYLYFLNELMNHENILSHNIWVYVSNACHASSQTTVRSSHSLKPFSSKFSSKMGEDRTCWQWFATITVM